MRIASYEFRPGLWPTLATLVLLPLMLGLGVWQLDRAAWKQGLVDVHAARIQQPAREFSALLSSGEPLQYRRAKVRGQFDLEHQLLLDNRTYQGRAGYHVLTPLQLPGLAGTVLVNRGWVALGNSRSELPVVDGPAGEVVLQVMIGLPPEKIFRLDSVEEVHAGWPRVIQQIELEQLEQLLGYTLLPVILLLDSEDAHGYVREWKPIYGVTPDKHRAYALQWFTLALVLFAIYIGVNTRRISY